MALPQERLNFGGAALKQCGEVKGDLRLCSTLRVETMNLHNSSGVTRVYVKISTHFQLVIVISSEDSILLQHTCWDVNS